MQGGAFVCCFANELGRQIKISGFDIPAGDNKLSTESWQTLYERAGSFIRRWSTGMGMVFIKKEDKQNSLAVPVLINDFKHTPPT